MSEIGKFLNDSFTDQFPLREKYEWVRFLEQELNNKHTPDEIAYIKDWIIREKKKIRKIINKPNRYDRIVKDYGIDGFIVLIELPDYISDEESATEYMEECEYMECAPSMYDCTGQLFTSWYKVFERNGKWMAYHSISCDV